MQVYLRRYKDKYFLSVTEPEWVFSREYGDLVFAGDGSSRISHKLAQLLLQGLKLEENETIVLEYVPSKKAPKRMTELPPKPFVKIMKGDVNENPLSFE